MAGRQQNNPESPTPSVPPEQGIELIQRQIERAKELDASGDIGANLGNWVSVTREVLWQAFGRGAPEIGNFLNAPALAYPPDHDPFGPAAGSWEVHLNDPRRCLDCYVKKLEGFIGVLQVRIRTRSNGEQGMNHDTAAVCENGHVINSHVSKRPTGCPGLPDVRNSAARYASTGAAAGEAKFAAQLAGSNSSILLAGCVATRTRTSAR